MPADHVECPGVPGSVMGGLVQLQRLLGVAQCLFRVALPVGYPSEVEVGTGLAGLVTDFTEQPQGVLVVGVGVLVVAQPGAGMAQAIVGMALPLAVMRVLGGGQGGVLDGG